MFKRAEMLLLEKCDDKKRFMPPFSWVIYPLTWPKVANQQKKEPYEYCITKSLLKLCYWDVLVIQRPGIPGIKGIYYELFPFESQAFKT